MEKLHFTYSQLLTEAVNTPGKLNEAYWYFYRYSVFNQLLLRSQGCASPVATFKKWVERGRTIKKNMKAKMIVIPQTYKKIETDEFGEDEVTGTYFTFRNCIFSLDDTIGEDYHMDKRNVPSFDKTKLLTTLNIKEIPFRKLDGNVQGYAYTATKEIAINPLGFNHDKTLLHEVAHCLLHGKDNQNGTFHHGSSLPKSIEEYEAESTAYIAGSMLNILDNESREFSRGYIQDWLQGSSSKVPESSARRIFSAVDKIIKALETEIVTGS